MANERALNLLEHDYIVHAIQETITYILGRKAGGEEGEGYFPDIYSQRLWRRECVEVRVNKLGGCVHEIFAPGIGVSPHFMEGCAEAL